MNQSLLFLQNYRLYQEELLDDRVAHQSDFIETEEDEDTSDSN